MQLRTKARPLIRERVRGLPRPVIILTCALVFVSCTDSGDANSSTSISQPSVTTTTTVPVAGEAAVEEYVQCLADEGVDIDSIPLDINGRPMLDAVNSQLDYSDAETVQALSECGGILTEGALDLGFDDDYRVEVVEQLAAFSRCVRARGAEDFPDPVPGFIGIGAPYPPSDIPYDDPELETAVAACNETVFGDFPGSGG